MRNLKRALSLALASVMLVGMMVVGTSAASYPDVDSNDNVEAISVLQAVGVMQGDGDTGEFRPDSEVSRNEMAVIMARLLLGPDADSYVGTHPFTDVPAWADKYVAACYNDGIIKGTSDTTYGGKETVTAQEAAAMMLRALGYEKLESTGADWARNVVNKANQIRLFADVGSNPNAAMTRNQIAQLGLNTLEATMVTTESGANINLGEIGSISTDVKYTDRTESSSNASDVCRAFGDAAVDGTKYALQLGEWLYDGDLKKITTAGTTDDFGFQAARWEYGTGSDKVIGKYPTAKVVATYTKAADVTLGDLYDLGDWQSGTVDIYENGVDSTNDLTTSAIVKGSDTKVTAFSGYNGAEVSIVDQNDDGEIDAVLVVYGYLGKVTKVNDATKSKDRNVEINVYGGVTATKIKYETEDWEKDDYVVVYPQAKLADSLTTSSELLKVEAAESVTGAVTAYGGATTSTYTSVTVDGEKYNMGATANFKDTLNLKKGEFTVYILNDHALGVLADDNYTADISDIVYALGAANNGVENGKTMYYVRVIHMDGTYEVLKTTVEPEDVDDEGFFALDTNEDGEYTFAEPADDTVLVTKASEIASATEVYAADELKTNISLKPDTKSIQVKNGGSEEKAYLTSDTRYIFVEDAKDKATLVTGGITKSLDASDNIKVLVSNTKDDGTGDNEVEAIIIEGSYNAAVGSDVLYLKSETKTGSNSVGNIYPAYDLDGNEMDDVVIKPAPASAGFYNYSVDSEGVYSLDAVDSIAVDDGAKTENGSYTITNQAVTYSSKRGTISITPFFDDMDVKDVVIIDLVDGHDFNSVEDLADTEAVSDITGVALVKDKSVSVIVVTAYTTAGGGGGGVAATAAKLEVTVSFKNGGSAVASPGWATNDKIVFTGSSSGGKTELSVTATKTDTGWNVTISKPATGYTGTFDGTTLTITASNAGATSGNPFDTPTATVTIADSSVDTVDVGTPTWTDGRDAS